MSGRALESDTWVREGSNEAVLTALQLRQASLVSIADDHPHRATIQAARDSARREALWRMSGGQREGTGAEVDAFMAEGDALKHAEEQKP